MPPSAAGPPGLGRFAGTHADGFGWFGRSTGMSGPPSWAGGGAVVFARRPRPPVRTSSLGPRDPSRGLVGSASADRPEGRQVLGRSVTTRQVAIGSPPIASIEQNRERSTRSVATVGSAFFRRPAAELRAIVDPSDELGAVPTPRGRRGGLWPTSQTTWGRAAGSAWPLSGTVYRRRAINSMSGPGRRGQAPKGTGGMPRRRRQCGRGRLRNARGSGRTRVDPEMPTMQPGELKHLSTRRNRKQPRFPQ